MTLKNLSTTTTIFSTGISTRKSTTEISISSHSSFPSSVLKTTINPTTTPAPRLTKLFLLPISSGSVGLTGSISLATLTSSTTTLSPAPIRITASISSYPLGQLQESSGVLLTDSEKPKILAIIAENVVAGLPNKNILIIKRLTERNRFSENEYKILRKDIFQSGSIFETIKHISSSFESISDTLYKTISSSFTVNQNDIFIVEDIHLLPHKTYAYKVEFDFDLTDITRFST